MEEFTCENCQLDYFTCADWEDECYCKSCYIQKYGYPDRRPVFLSASARVEQARRILPVVEAEIAGGEKRAIFFEIRKMCLEALNGST